MAVPSFKLRKPDEFDRFVEKKDKKRRASMKHKWSEDSKLDKIQQLARMHDALTFILDMHMDRWDIRQPWEYWSDGPYERPANNPSPKFTDWFLHPVLNQKTRDENRKNLAALTPQS